MFGSTNYTSLPTLPVLSKQNAEVVCGVGWAVGVWWSEEKGGGCNQELFWVVANGRS